MHIANAFHAGYDLAKKEVNDYRIEMKLFELTELVGKKVIVFGNEWEDMLVGTATKIDFITRAKQPVLVVEDCFTGQELTVYGHVCEFHIQTLDALLKLNPFERWNLKSQLAHVGWDKPKIGQITDPEQFRKNLKEIGFI